MASNQRPKFRSSDGCCVCGRKSSSSRFAPSKRWEHLLAGCFELAEKRFGIICNACVLIVKRYDRQIQTSGPVQTWSHVVDSRVGPGTKNMNKIKKKIEAIKEEQSSSSSQNGLKTVNSFQTKSNDGCGRYDESHDEIAKKRQNRRMILTRIVVPESMRRRTHPQVEGYETCCGVIYVTPTYDRTWRPAFPFFRPCGRIHSERNACESDSDDDDDDVTIITKLHSFVSSSSSTTTTSSSTTMTTSSSSLEKRETDDSAVGSPSSSSFAPPPSIVSDNDNDKDERSSSLQGDDVGDEAVAGVSPPGSARSGATAEEEDLFRDAVRSIATTDADDMSCVRSDGSDINSDLPYIFCHLDSIEQGVFSSSCSGTAMSHQRCVLFAV